MDDFRGSDRQENTRIGATVAFPFPRAQAIRFAASTSLSTAAGGDFTAFLLSYSRAW